MTDDPRLDLLRGTLDAFKRLRGADSEGDWPVLTLVAVKCTPIMAKTCDEALDHLKRAASTGRGWVRYRSQVARFGNGSADWIRSGDPEEGPPIAAEWSEGEATSWQLRLYQSGANQATTYGLWRYEERELTAGEDLQDQEHPALRQCVKVLEHPERRESEGVPCLVYHVFWSADKGDPSALRRLFARFVEFGQDPDLYVEDTGHRAGRG